MQSQKQQNDLGSFLRKTIQCHSNPRNGPTTNAKKMKLNGSMKTYKTWTNTKKRSSFHHRRLECKRRKSRDTWSNKFGLGVKNKAGQSLTEFWQENALVIANTLFQQNKRRLYTWTSPDNQYWKQIDHILCSQRWRSSIQSAKTRPGADCGSDHELFIAKFRLKLKKVGKTTTPFRYDLQKILYSGSEKWIQGWIYR